MCVLGVCRLFICEVTEPSPLRGSAACARRAAYPDRDLGSCGRLGESSNTWKHFGPEPTKAQYSVISVLVRQETVTWGGWTWALDSGSRITGGGSG